MCTGAEIGMLVVAAVGTTASLYAQDTAANEAEAAAESQALQAEADAKTAAQAAEVEAGRIRKQKQKDQAAAIAAASAAGVDVSSPTALRITGEIGKQGEEDAMWTLFNGGDTSRRLGSQAGGYRARGANAATAGRASQTATLLQGASNIGGQGYDAWKRSRTNTGG